VQIDVLRRRARENGFFYSDEASRIFEVSERALLQFVQEINRGPEAHSRDTLKTLEAVGNQNF
jgi:hypothetical protein